MSDGDRYWYAYCAACDWCGPERPTDDEAVADKARHACGRIADPAVYVVIREGQFEEIP